MEKCDLDACSLKEDIVEIKDTLKEASEADIERDKTQAVFVQKMDDYMVQGKKEHEILFQRTREMDAKQDNMELDLATRPTKTDMENINTSIGVVKESAESKLSRKQIVAYITVTGLIIGIVLSIGNFLIKLVEMGGG